jgi:mono/diheme cytochrome c family protein
MAARVCFPFSEAIGSCCPGVRGGWCSLHGKATGVPVAHAYHTPEEVEAYRGTQERALATGQNTYFMASGNCAGCHGHDPSGYASVTAEGQDVNVVDDWRSSIMANAARDPFWRPK